jgi:hypothetical protein
MDHHRGLTTAERSMDGRTSAAVLGVTASSGRRNASDAQTRNSAPACAGTLPSRSLSLRTDPDGRRGGDRNWQYDAENVYGIFEAHRRGESDAMAGRWATLQRIHH